jgi:proline dehydrogenase
MLRSFFITLSRAAWAQRLMTRRGLARQMTRRFVVGETASLALEVNQRLNANGELR